MESDKGLSYRDVEEITSKVFGKPQTERSDQHYLLEVEAHDRACSIAAVLNGAPLGQARHILDEAWKILLDTQLVDVNTNLFETRRIEFSAYYSEQDALHRG